jgi:hypothetical protein
MEKYMKNSLVRADSQRSCLVSRGFVSGRARACRLGEAQPATISGECFDEMGSNAIICRQVDRHGTIDLTGARVLRKSKCK